MCTSSITNNATKNNSQNQKPHTSSSLSSPSSSSSSSLDGRIQSLSLLSDHPMMSPSLTAVYSLQVLYNHNKPSIPIYLFVITLIPPYSLYLHAVPSLCNSPYTPLITTPLLTTTLSHHFLSLYYTFCTQFHPYAPVLLAAGKGGYVSLFRANTTATATANTKKVSLYTLPPVSPTTNEHYRHC